MPTVLRLDGFKFFLGIRIKWLTGVLGVSLYPRAGHPWLRCCGYRTE